MSPEQLLLLIRQWSKKFSESPELYFYRGNFFWRISVSDGFISANLIRKNSGGTLAINRALRWSIISAEPERVVKNLLDIIRAHERALQKQKKTVRSTA